MSEFRKKPIVIEAEKWDGTEENAKRLIAWMGDGEYFPAERINSEMFEPYMRIFTLEDGRRGECKHIATPNDWIIKGVHGEFYPCKPDIFEATYEVASAAPAEGPEAFPEESVAFEKWFNTKREHAHGWSPRYAAIEGWKAHSALATTPTMSEAALGARNKAVEQLRYFLKAKRFDRETFLDDSAFVDWVMSRSRALLAEIERIDRADAKRGSDGPAPD